MATAKKQKGGAPASAASKPVRPSKKPPKAVRSVVFRAKQAAAQTEVQNEINKRITPVGAPPFPYTEELGQRIFDMIVEGKSIMKIAAVEGMPCAVTMFKWIGDSTHPFANAYVRAKDLCVARFEEEIQDIADTPLKVAVRVEGQRVTKDGTVVNVVETRYGDAVEHRRLQIDARKWTLAHLRPRKHGRQADPEAGKPNDQLKALFDSLKAGPKE